jgi:hypothetical protein
MPFRIDKVGKDQYYVVTIDTGKKHSNHPISHDKALAQFRILESIYNKEELKSKK